MVRPKLSRHQEKSNRFKKSGSHAQAFSSANVKSFLRFFGFSLKSLSQKPRGRFLKAIPVGDSFVVIGESRSGSERRSKNPQVSTLILMGRKVEVHVGSADNDTLPVRRANFQSLCDIHACFELPGKTSNNPTDPNPKTKSLLDVLADLFS